MLPAAFAYTPFCCLYAYCYVYVGQWLLPANTAYGYVAGLLTHTCMLPAALSYTPWLLFLRLFYLLAASSLCSHDPFVV